MEYDKLIFKTKAGSHLYGLNTPNSDIDYVGVFLPKVENILGLNKMEQLDLSTKKTSEEHRNTKDDIDDNNYSISKFMRLLLQNNPNIVELLFSSDDSIIEASDIWKLISSNYEKFVSKKVYITFKGYATAQLKKINVKRERYESLSKSIAMIEATYSGEELANSKRPISELEASDLNGNIKYYKGDKHNCESFHKGMAIGMIYDKIKQEYESYGWRVKTDTFEKLGYDCKFGYHLIRILAECYEILKTGKLSFPISDQARLDILRVKYGKVEYKELVVIIDKYNKLCDDAFENTELRERPDFDFANDLLINILVDHIKKS